VFNGFPSIHRAQNSIIQIGNDCILNSSKHSVRINLERRCTLATLRKDAEIIIGNNTGLSGITIAADYKIIIGNNVLIGTYCTIIDNDFHNPDPSRRDEYTFPKKPVIIEDNVFIGMNCTILKGVTIGKNSVIGANSVVVTSIPSNSVAMGNPCKVFIKRNWKI
jgi:acetyltransferase-like isoleucine patch superfamily enzyme